MNHRNETLLCEVNKSDQRDLYAHPRHGLRVIRSDRILYLTSFYLSATAFASL